MVECGELLQAKWLLVPYRSRKNGETLESFQPGTEFSQVAHLYEFDRKLGTLIHDGLERIEVALRASLVETLGVQGPMVYQDPTVFRPDFNHRKWMARARKRVERARRHSAVVQHHDKHYDGQLPLWVLVDFLDFSDSSQLFEGLRAADQFSVAQTLNMAPDVQVLSKTQARKVKKQQPLVRWLEQLTILRNTTAHYGRVWNSTYVPAGTTALKASFSNFGSLPESTSYRVYGSLVVIRHILSLVSPGSTWLWKVRTLVEDLFYLLRACR